MEKLIKLLTIFMAFVVINLLVLDGLLIGDYLAGLDKKIPTPTIVPTQQERSTEYIDQCGSECQIYVNAQIATLAAKLNVKIPTPTPQKVVAAPAKPKTTTVAYVPIPGSGSTTANDWSDLSGTDFYFNTADYPGLVSVYFEPTVSLVNGNGVAYVRLFDVTHGIAVEGGWAQTSSQTPAALESGQAFFWSGKNLIRVQAKSLTADTVVFDGGRLKVTTSN